MLSHAGSAVCHEIHGPEMKALGTGLRKSNTVVLIAEGSLSNILETPWTKRLHVIDRKRSLMMQPSVPEEASMVLCSLRNHSIPSQT